ncbi:AP2/ERF and B3 domain-containing protein [Actinidia chinensis var. chinensis]|uniref:AP2/ERF and B3 domain-containing protein n=1 Tax=Actinidia chinensis var. chinensis TaxID=1590841 RepID=A0A2R6R399_ACTCC|nr:AP2/ERF and B3 domain-containing protein [Actinidia chinensis var. chinensis]
MSESRDIGNGQEDKKGKRKFSDLQQQEETETGTGKQGRTDQTHHELISKSQLGELLISDDTMVTSSSTKLIEFKPENFRFEKELTANDVEHGIISFPYSTISDYFPPVAGKPSELQIEVSDPPLDTEWQMTVKYDAAQRKFLITSGWEDFWNAHDFLGSAMIYFYIPLPRLHARHYLIEYVRLQDRDIENTTESDSDDYAYANNDILGRVMVFELKVNRIDFKDGRLVLPYEEARENFQEIEIPPETHEMERICFTDAWVRNWSMEVMFKNELDAYLVHDGGKEFVDYLNLKAADVIKFYEPDNAWDPMRHFLVDCVKSNSHIPGSSSGS